MTRGRDIIFVTGATGKIGTALVHWLASNTNQPIIRAATRNINSDQALLLQAFNPQTVQLVPFDNDNAAALETAFEGVTKLCIIAPFVDDMAAWHAKLINAALKVGSCNYVVKVSVTGARSPDSEPPPGRIPLAHWQGEEVIRQSGLSATIIRPTIFMQHFLTVPGLYRSGDDRFYLPTGAGRIAFLDCRDIATCAAKLLCSTPTERRPYENQAFELTGPTAVTANEIASILSWVTGTKFAHIDGEAAFVEHCRSLNVGDGAKYTYAEAAEDWFSKVEAEVYSQLVGQRPTSFAKFAFDHASYFKPN